MTRRVQEGSRCCECGAPAAHDHHVVPVSYGGTFTVPLCTACHGKVHGRFFAHPYLTKRGMARKRARNERITRPDRVPYGCMVHADGVHLIPHPDEERLIRRIGFLRKKNMSLRGIARALATHGLFSRSGRPFCHSAIQTILERHFGEQR